MHWASIVVDHVTAVNRGGSMFRRREQWDADHDRALNQALLDRTRLVTALYNLLTAVQAAHPNMAPAGLLRAEEEAVNALSSVGGGRVE